MSFLERRASRRALLSKAGVLGGGITIALFLGCEDKKDQQELENWCVVEIPQNETVGLDIKDLQSAPFGATKLYVYSNSSENWAWFTLVFESQTAPRDINFYLAKYYPGFNTNNKDQWLAEPEVDEVSINDSLSQAFSDLQSRFGSDELTKELSGRSVVFPVEKPGTKDSYVFIYEDLESDSKIEGYLFLKLVFQPQQIGSV